MQIYTFSSKPTRVFFLNQLERFTLLANQIRNSVDAPPITSSKTSFGEAVRDELKLWFISSAIATAATRSIANTNGRRTLKAR